MDEIEYDKAISSHMYPFMRYEVIKIPLTAIEIKMNFESKTGKSFLEK